MTPQPPLPGQSIEAADAGAAYDAYRRLLEFWNAVDGEGFASLFARDGSFVGFDGSQIDGRAALSSVLRRIFADHARPPFVGIVRWIRGLGPDIAMLRSVVGMIPIGASDIDPALNAFQTLILRRTEETWLVELFQNTPANFHNRPQECETLSRELSAALTAHGVGVAPIPRPPPTPAGQAPER